LKTGDVSHEENVLLPRDATENGVNSDLVNDRPVVVSEHCIVVELDVRLQYHLTEIYQNLFFLFVHNQDATHLALLNNLMCAHDFEEGLQILNLLLCDRIKVRLFGEFNEKEIIACLRVIVLERHQFYWRLFEGEENVYA